MDKTIDDFNKWAETHKFEYQKISNSTSWASHTTPNGSIIEEKIYRGSIFKPIVNTFLLCYSFKDHPINIDLVTNYGGEIIQDPYSTSNKLIAMFDDLENAWLFAENEKLNLMV